MSTRYWAQFYHLRQDPDGHFRFVEGVGDRQMVILDGRWSRSHMCAVAAEECRKRKFGGWALMRSWNGRLDSPFQLTGIKAEGEAAETLAHA